MGPYYRGTSQGMGAFFDMLYRHPILMLLFMAGAVGAGIYVWNRKRSSKESGV